MRLLIVEDDQEVAGTLKDILESEGYKTEVAGSGMQGLRLASRGSFDAALLDLQVQDLSGLAVQRAVQDFGPLPVIVMSASLGEWRREAIAGGATACLSKPFDLADLLGLLSTLQASRSKHGDWSGDVRELDTADLERLGQLSAESLDALPFGVICLNRDQRVFRYNAFESTSAQLVQADVVGKPFADIAPCSLVKDFGRALQDGFARRELSQVLRFVFPHHRGRAVVSVRFYFDRMHDRMWLFISKRPGEASQALGDEEAALDRMLTPEKPVLH